MKRLSRNQNLRHTIHTKLPLLVRCKMGNSGEPPESIDCTTLANTLAAIEEFEFTSPDISFLIATSQFVLKIRTGWKQNAWAEISLLINGAKLEDFR